jgi:hypothetical protein
MDLELRAAYIKWVKQYRDTLDVCATLHTPIAMKAAENGWDSDFLQKQLWRYFNNLDRRVFKAAHRNRAVRLYRWVTLEKSETVGWHAHISISTPDNFTQAEFIDLAKTLWLKQIARYTNPKFKSRLSVIEPIEGEFFRYSVKSIRGTKEDSNGVLDLENIHLPR